jgi:hypothetical protein
VPAPVRLPQFQQPDPATDTLDTQFLAPFQQWQSLVLEQFELFQQQFFKFQQFEFQFEFFRQ